MRVLPRSTPDHWSYPSGRVESTCRTPSSIPLTSGEFRVRVSSDTVPSPTTRSIHILSKQRNREEPIRHLRPIGVVELEPGSHPGSNRNLRILLWNPNSGLFHRGEGPSVTPVLRHLSRSVSVESELSSDVDPSSLEGSPRSLSDQRVKGRTSTCHRRRCRHTGDIDSRVLPWNDSDEIRTYKHSKVHPKERSRYRDTLEIRRDM